MAVKTLTGILTPSGISSGTGIIYPGSLRRAERLSEVGYLTFNLFDFNFKLFDFDSELIEIPNGYYGLFLVKQSESISRVDRNASHEFNLVIPEPDWSAADNLLALVDQLTTTPDSSPRASNLDLYDSYNGNLDAIPSNHHAFIGIKFRDREDDSIKSLGFVVDSEGGSYPIHPGMVFRVESRKGKLLIDHSLIIEAGITEILFKKQFKGIINAKALLRDGDQELYLLTEHLEVLSYD